MPLLLIVEDSVADRRRATAIAEKAGFTEFELRHYAANTRVFLEEALEGKSRLPDAIVIDLDLGLESGSSFSGFGTTRRGSMRSP